MLGPNVAPGRQRIVLVWAIEHGRCRECGRPAAYDVVDAHGPGKHRRACCRCAALAAAAGQQILLLNAEPAIEGSTEPSVPVNDAALLDRLPAQPMPQSTGASRWDGAGQGLPVRA